MLLWDKSFSMVDFVSKSIAQIDRFPFVDKLYLNQINKLPADDEQCRDCENVSSDFSLRRL